ncbi:thioredoxin-like [Ptychodera flava]|uniref:thioredoxin-like n=1 Tax=Ptychodera flava TaxID=63121 RepID=UPI00396A17AC
MPVIVVKTKDAFDAELKNAGSKLVTVDFTAAWCPPCQSIGPKFEALSDEITDVVFLKVDVDDNSETAETYNISAMPTFVFFKNGKELERFSGASEEKLRATIAKNK